MKDNVQRIKFPRTGVAVIVTHKRKVLFGERVITWWLDQDGGACRCDRKAGGKRRNRTGTQEYSIRYLY